MGIVLSTLYACPNYPSSRVHFIGEAICKTTGYYKVHVGVEYNSDITGAIMDMGDFGAKTVGFSNCMPTITFVSNEIDKNTSLDELVDRCFKANAVHGDNTDIIELSGDPIMTKAKDKILFENVFFNTLALYGIAVIQRTASPGPDLQACLEKLRRERSLYDIERGDLNENAPLERLNISKRMLRAILNSYHGVKVESS